MARGAGFFRNNGFEVHEVVVAEGWDTDAQVDRQLWADVIVLQFPVNSMGPPWILKKYLDEVYTAGMDGRLSSGDGRSRTDATKRYGTGGKMTDKAYMLSVTLNAPRNAFADVDQSFFAGATIDDVLNPIHLNFKFFGLAPLPTFAAYDVSKNPTIESDFERFDAHLAASFGASRG